MGEKKEETEKNSHEAYMKAYEIAENHLESTDPMRLGLALNYSVFYYEVKKSTAEACKLARKAFDSAIFDFDSLSEASYRDATIIMQLLRDNLTLWTTGESENEDEYEKENNA